MRGSKMWKEDVSAWQLRMAFPREANLLENIMVHEELKKLGLIVTKHSRAKRCKFSIKFKNNYEIVISPVDVGHDGFTEWFTWYQAESNESAGLGASMPKYSIRANIKLFATSKYNREELHSFTQHQQSIEMLLRNALELIKDDLGLQLKPILNQSNLKGSKL